MARNLFIIVYAVIFHNRGQLKTDVNNHIALVSQLSCRSFESINVSTSRHNKMQLKQNRCVIRSSTQRKDSLRCVDD